MQLIDGYNGGVAHISAGMIRDHNISLYGDGDYVLPVGSNFSYDVVNNNTIRISDGMAVIGGARAIIEYGKIETVVIENGVSGYKRNDIIVIEYTKDNETLVESASVKVVKGQLGSSGVDPTLIDGNVRAGATAKQMALYRVRINGLSIEGVDTLWDSAVFPVTAGGTGATTASDARKNLLENKPLSAEEGGTGVSSREEMFERAEFIKDNVSVKAGAAIEISIDISSKTNAGYIPFGLIGSYMSNASSSGANVSNMALYGMYISESGTAVLKARNTGSSAAKVKAVAKIVFLKP